MPIYEYFCPDCRNVFDALRPMAQADEPLPCPQCGGQKASRKISVFYARSEGRSVAGTASACSGCSATTCSTCGVR
jgi:putative FmdB family regulatory protein